MICHLVVCYFSKTYLAIVTCRGVSRMSGNVVHMNEGVVLILFFLKYPIKMKLFGLTEQKDI